MQTRMVPRSCDCISDATVLRVRRFGGDALAVVEQRLPDLGHFQPMGAALQQHRADLPFELAQLAAERGFRRLPGARPPD